MEGLPLDHVAIAVPSLEEASTLQARLTGASPSAIETLPEQGVRVLFLGAVELLEPLSAENPVGRFLAGRSGALHHVAYRTPDIRKEIERLRLVGFQPIDETPRPGARGHQVAFLHPRSTGGVLVELVEHRE